MATLRELKGRIGSVASSEKITGAMKMISSAKMHKAEGILRRLSPFRDCVQTIIAALLSSDAQFSSPLTEPHHDVRTIGLVVLGSDDGLCGGYNVNIFKGMLESIKQLRQRYGDNVRFAIFPVGKKMNRIVTRMAENDPFVEIRNVGDINSKSDGEQVKSFARDIEHSFLTGALDEVHTIYMHFISAGKQRFKAETYLPAAPQGAETPVSAGKPYIFEPDPDTIFATVLPMYLLSCMQEAFAQNRASEQAARVMAMQSANDNAQKLLEQLQLEYNKLRQQAITTELLDIVGGQVRD